MKDEFHTTAIPRLGTWRSTLRSKKCRLPIEIDGEIHGVYPAGASLHLAGVCPAVLTIDNHMNKS